MLKHLTLLNWIQWIFIVYIQIEILKHSWRKIKTLTLSIIYLLIESVVLTVITFVGSAKLYSQTFYFMGIIECLLLSAVSIELSASCIESMKEKISKFGPLIIAAPTFCIMVIFFPFDFSKFSTMVVRTSQIAFTLSLSLLFICFAFEDKKPKLKLVSRSYAIFLSLLTICSQLQLEYGFATFVRQSWIFSWIIGLSLVLLSLIRCSNIGNSNINRRTQHGYSGEHGPGIITNPYLSSN